MLGLPGEDGDKFRVFIHRILETPGQHDDIDPSETLVGYLNAKIRERRESGADGHDLISYLHTVEDPDGNRLSDEHVFVPTPLLPTAHSDTTPAALLARLRHTAQPPSDPHRRAATPAPP